MFVEGFGQVGDGFEIYYKVISILCIKWYIDWV